MRNKTAVEILLCEFRLLKGSHRIHRMRNKTAVEIMLLQLWCLPYWTQYLLGSVVGTHGAPNGRPVKKGHPLMKDIFHVWFMKLVYHHQESFVGLDVVVAQCCCGSMLLIGIFHVWCDLWSQYISVYLKRIDAYNYIPYYLCRLKNARAIFVP